MNPRLRSLLAILVLTPIAGLGFQPSAASAQRALTVEGRRDLRFRELIPGVATNIPPPDNDAGQFRLRGEMNMEVEIVLTLPADMDDGLGNTIPLTFGPADGRWNAGGNRRTATPFDPTLPLVAMMTNSGRIVVFLGGTATPASQQRAGNYTGDITLTVSNLGT